MFELLIDYIGELGNFFQVPTRRRGNDKINLCTMKIVIDSYKRTFIGIDQVVMDTNVLIAALRSKHGASFKFLSLVKSNYFQINISVPLILEYEDVAKRESQQEALRHEDIDNILDFLCSVANPHKIFFLWRPYLKDFKDDFVLELAIAARCDFIITYNKRDFKGVEQFGILVLTPKEFLKEKGLL